MANVSARFRKSGSFVAGVLIGLSIVIATFALTDAVSGAWQILLIFGAPVVLVLGLALQVLSTSGLRRRRATDTGREDFAYGIATIMEA